MRLNRDETLTPIGFQKVDEFFYGDVDIGALALTRAYNDPRNQLVWFPYFSTGNSTSYSDKALVFNWLTEEWRVIDTLVSSVLVPTILPGYTMEELDTVFGTNLDTDVPFSLDNSALNGFQPSFGSFRSDDKLYFYTGSPEAAEIETGEFQLNPNGRAFVQSVYPIIHGTNDMTVCVGHREQFGDSWSFGADVATETTTGEAPQRVTGRFHKARIKIPKGTSWTKAQGVLTPQFVPDGRR